MTVTQIEPIRVIFTLPSGDIPKVQQAQAKGAVVVQAYDAASKVKLDEGKLLLIDNQVDVAPGTVRLKAVFPNAARALWPGIFVNAHVVVSVAHDALTLPLPAVQQEAGRCFRLCDCSHADDRRSGGDDWSIAAGGEIVITKGTECGDTVVLTGQYRLSEGTSVEVVPSGRRNEVQDASTASAGMLP